MPTMGRHEGLVSSGIELVDPIDGEGTDQEGSWVLIGREGGEKFRTLAD